MPDDFDAYRTTVLDTARRAGNQPPADLFVRYHLDPRGVGTPEEFARQVAAVAKYWRALKLKKLYQPLATALLAAHTDLERRSLLNLEAFTEQREQGRGKAQEQLDRRIEVIASSSPCITLTGLHRLVGGVDNAFTEQEVREALKGRGITVIDPPWDLPPGPAIPAARSLRAPLTALGFKLSPEVLFGTEAVRAGFSLRDGFRLAADNRMVTLALLEKARDEQTRTSQDERKTAMDNVLAILLPATQANTVRELITWEVREHLRPDLEAGLPVRLIAHTATELGLDATEALHLAVTLAGEGTTGKRDGGTAQLVAEALTAGELQEARRLLDGLLAGECVQERAQLDEALRRVADLLARAEAAWAGGDHEDAAGLLAAAGEIARDDETLSARLAAIPPPPPGEVTAGLDGDRVVVRWTPSPARTNPVQYRLVRSTGTPAVSSGSGTTVVETSGNEAVDETPPTADPVHYSVFASRGGAWSAGASAPAVEPLPEVVDVRLTSDETSVTGTWRAHRDAVEIEVTRTPRSTPGASPEKVPTRHDGGSTFVDSSVRSGETYDYAFRAVYHTRAGARRVSEPVVASASPVTRPEPVTELAHEVVQEYGRAVMRLTWRNPAAGDVEIRTSVDGPEWPVGTYITRQAANGFGQPAGGNTTSENGRAGLDIPVRQGRVTATAITSAGDHAVVGASTSLSLVDKVTGVRADRLDDLVRVRWIWPRGAHVVRVRWWPDDGVVPPVHVEQVEISERVHTDGGGAEFTAGAGPLVVSLQTVTRTRDEESVSAAVLTKVAGRPAKVSYAVRQVGLPGLRKLTLTLTSDRHCRLPPVVVVHRTDGILPLRPDRGRVVTTFPAQNLSPGLPLSLPLPERPTPLSGFACFVDPNTEHADEVTLVPLISR
ncbi:hypothetical protein FHS29_006215 [Saccharothrix tamanrassetensis]|uniref:Fibronectin type-III domain-containing protein n=1 Tax=Saccharothrix tamanrassetensis TaxID=1051531 RepID=A0A841CTF2_9PSEU|nr:hypothetical protein [Saccharothrix tamanrassetensis]MBB5959594.1 hypothetical protein [Saccharothrix tamanrassetensis]